MAKKQSLEQIETSLARWKTRLRRAITMIDKLERQQKRLRARPARGSSDEPAVEKPSPVSAPVPPSPVALTPREAVLTGRIMDEGPYVKPGVDGDIPAFLRRQSPDPMAEQIRAEQAEAKLAKSRGRIATMKAKKSGETRKMPLTGKAALAAIRG